MVEPGEMAMVPTEEAYERREDSVPIRLVQDSMSAPGSGAGQAVPIGKAKCAQMVWAGDTRDVLHRERELQKEPRGKR